MTITGPGRSSNDETVKGKQSELKVIQEPERKELVPGWLRRGWDRKGEREGGITVTLGLLARVLKFHKDLYLETDTTFVIINSGLNFL